MNKSIVTIAVILAATLVVATFAATPDAFADGRGGNSFFKQKIEQNNVVSGHDQHVNNCIKNLNGHTVPC